MAIRKALSRGTTGDTTEVLTISDSEVDDAMHSDDISEYSLSNPSDVDPLPEPTRRKDKGKGKAIMAHTNPELSESDEFEIIQFTTSSSTSNALTTAGTDRETGSATAAQSQSETTPRVFTDLPLMVGSDFESNSGTMLPVIRTQTVTPAGSSVSIPLVSLPADMSCASHAGPNWIEAPCVRGVWGQRISDLGFKWSGQREQANQI